MFVLLLNLVRTKTYCFGDEENPCPSDYNVAGQPWSNFITSATEGSEVYATTKVNIDDFTKTMKLFKVPGTPGKYRVFLGQNELRVKENRVVINGKIKIYTDSVAFMIDDTFNFGESSANWGNREETEIYFRKHLTTITGDYFGQMTAIIERDLADEDDNGERVFYFPSLFQLSGFIEKDYGLKWLISVQYGFCIVKNANFGVPQVCKDHKADRLIDSSSLDTINGMNEYSTMCVTQDTTLELNFEYIAGTIYVLDDVIFHVFTFSHFVVRDNDLLEVIRGSEFPKLFLKGCNLHLRLPYDEQWFTRFRIDGDKDYGNSNTSISAKWVDDTECIFMEGNYSGHLTAKFYSGNDNDKSVILSIPFSFKETEKSEIGFTSIDDRISFSHPQLCLVGEDSKKYTCKDPDNGYHFDYYVGRFPTLVRKESRRIVMGDAYVDMNSPDIDSTIEWLNLNFDNLVLQEESILEIRNVFSIEVLSKDETTGVKEFKLNNQWELKFKGKVRFMVLDYLEISSQNNYEDENITLDFCKQFVIIMINTETNFCVYGNKNSSIPNVTVRTNGKDQLKFFEGGNQQDPEDFTFEVIQFRNFYMCDKEHPEFNYNNYNCEDIPVNFIRLDSWDQVDAGDTVTVINTVINTDSYTENISPYFIRNYQFRFSKKIPIYVKLMGQETIYLNNKEIIQLDHDSVSIPGINISAADEISGPCSLSLYLPDEKNAITTLKGFYVGDKLHAELLLSHDFEGNTVVISNYTSASNETYITVRGQPDGVSFKNFNYVKQNGDLLPNPPFHRSVDPYFAVNEVPFPITILKYCIAKTDDDQQDCKTKNDAYSSSSIFQYDEFVPQKGEITYDVVEVFSTLSLVIDLESMHPGYYRYIFEGTPEDSKLNIENSMVLEYAGIQDGADTFTFIYLKEDNQKITLETRNILQYNVNVLNEITFNFTEPVPTEITYILYLNSESVTFKDLQPNLTIPLGIKYSGDTLIRPNNIDQEKFGIIFNTTLMVVQNTYLERILICPRENKTNCLKQVLESDKFAKYKEENDLLITTLFYDPQQWTNEVDPLYIYYSEQPEIQKKPTYIYLGFEKEIVVPMDIPLNNKLIPMNAIPEENQNKILYTGVKDIKIDGNTVKLISTDKTLTIDGSNAKESFIIEVGERLNILQSNLKSDLQFDLKLKSNLESKAIITIDNVTTNTPIFNIINNSKGVEIYQGDLIDKKNIHFKNTSEPENNDGEVIFKEGYVNVYCVAVSEEDRSHCPNSTTKYVDSEYFNSESKLDHNEIVFATIKTKINFLNMGYKVKLDKVEDTSGRFDVDLPSSSTLKVDGKKLFINDVEVFTPYIRMTVGEELIFASGKENWGDNHKTYLILNKQNTIFKGDYQGVFSAKLKMKSQDYNQENFYSISLPYGFNTNGFLRGDLGYYIDFNFRGLCIVQEIEDILPVSCEKYQADIQSTSFPKTFYPNNFVVLKDISLNALNKNIKGNFYVKEDSTLTISDVSILTPIDSNHIIVNNNTEFKVYNSYGSKIIFEVPNDKLIINSTIDGYSFFFGDINSKKFKIHLLSSKKEIVFKGLLKTYFGALIYADEPKTVKLPFSFKFTEDGLAFVPDKTPGKEITFLRPILCVSPFANESCGTPPNGYYYEQTSEWPQTWRNEGVYYYDSRIIKLGADMELTQMNYNKYDLNGHFITIKNVKSIYIEPETREIAVSDPNYLEYVSFDDFNLRLEIEEICDVNSNDISIEFDFNSSNIIFVFPHSKASLITTSGHIQFNNPFEKTIEGKLTLATSCNSENTDYRGCFNETKLSDDFVLYQYHGTKVLCDKDDDDKNVEKCPKGGDQVIITSLSDVISGETIKVYLKELELSVNYLMKFYQTTKFSLEDNCHLTLTDWDSSIGYLQLGYKSQGEIEYHRNFISYMAFDQYEMWEGLTLLNPQPKWVIELSESGTGKVTLPMTYANKQLHIAGFKINNAIEINVTEANSIIHYSIKDIDDTFISISKDSGVPDGSKLYYNNLIESDNNKLPFLQNVNLNFEKYIPIIKYCIAQTEVDKEKCKTENDVDENNIKESFSSEIIPDGNEIVEIYSYINNTIDLSLMTPGTYKYTFEGENEKNTINIENAVYLKSTGKDNYADTFTFSYQSVILEMKSVSKYNVKPKNVIDITIDFEKPFNPDKSITYDVELESYYTHIIDKINDNSPVGDSFRFIGEGLISSNNNDVTRHKFTFDPRLVHVYDDELEQILICPTDESGQFDPNCLKQLMSFENVKVAHTSEYDDEYLKTTLIYHSSNIYVPLNSSRQKIPTYIYLGFPEGFETLEVPINKRIPHKIIPLPKYIPPENNLGVLSALKYKSEVIPNLKYTHMKSVQINVDSMTFSSDFNLVTLENSQSDTKFHNTMEVDERLDIINNLEEQSHMDFSIKLTKDSIITMTKVTNLPPITIQGNNHALKLYTGDSSIEDAQRLFTVNDATVEFLEGVPMTPSEIITSSENNKKRGLSGAAIAGIVIGCVIFITAAVFLAIIMIKKKKSAHNNNNNEEEEEVNELVINL